MLIKQIESSDCIQTIGSAISNLLSLTQDGPQLCSIIAKVVCTSLRGCLYFRSQDSEQSCTYSAHYAALPFQFEIRKRKPDSKSRLAIS